MPVILASWETKIGRIMVQGQPGQIVHESCISRKITRAKWTRGMAQVATPALQAQSTEFKPHQKIK
jgi:hypothetical protein